MVSMKKLLFLSTILMFACVLFAQEQKKVTIIAHQGEMKLEPPNTPQSVKRAFDTGSKYVEFDVAETESGELICVHWDNELKYQWGINKPLPKVTKEDIENSRHQWKHVLARYPDIKLPVLDEILAVVPKDGILIVDIKRFTKDFPKKFDDAIMKAGLKRSNMYIPHAFIMEFRKISKQYKNAMYSIYLHKPSTEKNLTAEEIIEYVNNHPAKKYIKNIGIGQAGQGKEFFKRLNDKDFFRKIKAAGYQAAAWTTDSLADAKCLIEEYDVDIIYSNIAEKMRSDLGLPKDRK